MSRIQSIPPNVRAVTNRQGILNDGEADAGVRMQWNPRYSRLTASSTSASPSGTGVWTFFRDNFDPNNTNLRTPGKLSQIGRYVASGLGFHVTLSGSASAQIGAPTSNGTAQLDNAEVIRKYLEAGAIVLRKNGRDVFTDFGLYKYPSGGGIHVVGGLAVTGTTLERQALVVNNGMPTVDNRFLFPLPIAFDPQDTVELTVSYATNPTSPSNTLAVLTATIFGMEAVDSQQ